MKTNYWRLRNFATSLVKSPRPKIRGDVRWSVAATVKEPMVVLLPFVCHHLEMGADEIILYFDDPDDPSIGQIGAIDGVQAVICDAPYWAKRKGRPNGQNGRQKSNLQDALARTTSHWVVHIDADEFLWSSSSVTEDILRLKMHHDWMAFLPAERVWEGTYSQGTYDGVFRTPLPDDDPLIVQVYGQEAPWLPSGLSGYRNYKPAIPHHTGFQPRIHHLTDIGKTVPRPYTSAASSRVLHFEALTRDKWALKLLRYAASRRVLEVTGPRWRFIKHVVAQEDILGALYEAFDRAYVLRPEQVASLEERDALIRPELDLKAAVARRAPGIDMDWSRATLDARIKPALDAVLAEVDRARDHILSLDHADGIPT